MRSGLQPGLVVSCQANPGDPLDVAEVIGAMADSAVLGGAIGLRIQGLRDLAKVCASATVPVIGLWKDRTGSNDVFITPTLRHALAVVNAGADIVAIDATGRPRPDGLTIEDTIRQLKSLTHADVLADVATLEDALRAEDAGADAVATTLSGYVGIGGIPTGPDLELVRVLAQRMGIPVIAEGRISTPRESRDAMDAGAYAVVVGGAITRVASITAQFSSAVMSATRTSERAREDLT